MKKILLICLVGLMLTINTACDTTNAHSGISPKIVMVTPLASKGDETFNHSAYDGIIKASDDYKIEISVIEPETQDEYIETVSEAASKGADLVIAVGYIEADKLKSIASESPDTMFAVVDSDCEGPDNVMNITFKNEEGAFLIGVISALTTETGKLGYVGGAKDETAEALEYGFLAGIEAANPQVEVAVEYVNGFDDPESGKEAAMTLIENGCDVIFHAAGESGVGVIEAAAEMDAWAVSIDQNNSTYNHDAVLCSLFKRVDNGVYLSIQNFLEGKFSGGVYEFGLDFEAVGYVDRCKNLKKEVRDQADRYAKAILSGEIKVPKNKTQFKDFKTSNNDEAVLL